MRLQPRMRERPPLVVQPSERIGSDIHSAAAQVPPVPLPRRLAPHPVVVRRQQAVVPGVRIVSLPGGKVAEEPLVGVREEACRADPPAAPRQLGPARRRHAAEDQRADRPGVRLRVEQRQRRAPRPAEHHVPPRNAQVRAQGLDVGDEEERRVLAELAAGRRLAGSALVEQDHAVNGWVEVRRVAARGVAAGPAVEENC